MAIKVRTVRVPDREWVPAQEIAAARGETLTDVIRAAIREYIEAYSDSVEA